MAKRKKQKKVKLTILKIKRGALFCLGLTFFTFPSQNWYLTIDSKYQLPSARAIEVSLPSLADYPIDLFEGGEERNFSGKFLVLTAHSAAVIDRDSAVPLFQKNETVKFLPASTVKIMTALIALDYYRLDDVLTVSKVSSEGQDMNLIPGEEISVENLLYGLLVASANDAALVLAQNYPGGGAGFVAAMNQKAKELNLNNTYFANPTGLDSDRKGDLLPKRSYVAALDLARLAGWALKNEVFVKMVSTQFITVSDVSGRFQHPLHNINELLERLPGVKGVKTGWTEEAGECLVGYIERDNHGLITVVLGSEDRFGETTELVDWVFNHYSWQSIAPVL